MSKTRMILPCVMFFAFVIVIVLALIKMDYQHDYTITVSRDYHKHLKHISFDIMVKAVDVKIRSDNKRYTTIEASGVIKIKKHVYTRATIWVPNTYEQYLWKDWLARQRRNPKNFHDLPPAYPIFND